MPSGKSKSNANSNTSGTLTRNKLREITKQLEVTKMSQEDDKTSLSQVLSLTVPFNTKKITNIKFYLEEFDSFLDRAEIKEDFRLQILKAKFTGSAGEKLMLDDNLNKEKNYSNFKKKILDIFSKRELFTENQTKFNSIKQKPDQSVREFIEEFNILASKYLNITGYANEKGAKDFFELIKITKFLDAIAPLISLELRKSDIKEYSKLCEKALQLESAFKSTIGDQIINIQNFGVIYLIFKWSKRY